MTAQRRQCATVGCTRKASRGRRLYRLCLIAQRASDADWPRCSVADCDTPADRRGLCNMHAHHVDRSWTTDLSPRKLGLDSPTWSGAPSYTTVQWRLRRARGSASGPGSPLATWTHHRARVAVLSRDHASDDPELLDERRKLREARLADYIKRTVDAFPPLTPEARGRLAVLLRDADPEPNGSAGR